MDRKRSKLLVEIDLDPTPGWGHQPESHRHLIQQFLDQTITHYKPKVSVLDIESDRELGHALAAHVICEEDACPPDDTIEPSTYQPILDRCADCGYEFANGERVYHWFEHYICGTCAGSFRAHTSLGSHIIEVPA